MSLPILHAIGALTAALCYLVLTLYVVIAWARKLTSRWMLIASLATLMLLATRFVTGLSPATLVIESVATVSWLVFLAETLGVWHDTDGASGTRTALTVSVIGVAMGLLSILTFAVAQVFEAPPALSPVAIRAVLELLLAVAGLVLLEQLYRNTRSEQRWRSRHLVTGLGGLFTYDLVLQAVALLYPQKLTAFYAVQPMVFAVTAPFLAIAIRRTVDAPLAMHLSREFVFRTSVLIGAGVFLLAASLLGYLVQFLGGDWPYALLAFFIILVVMGLALVLGSNRVRSRGRRWVIENVFRSKYDYRRQWQEVTRRLTEPSSDYDLGQQVIRALGAITLSEGGGVWTLSEQRTLIPLSVLRTDWRRPLSREVTGMLLTHFETHQDAIDLASTATTAHASFGGLKESFDLLRFIVPLKIESRLVGIVGLRVPQTRLLLSWEDQDLLRLIAREAAGYIALQIAERALADAGKLSSVNQVSAFIVHDAKTISAQLSLLLKNAERHRDNPAFIEDMLKTVANSVTRVDRLLMQLREPEPESVAPGLLIQAMAVDIVPAIRICVESYHREHPWLVFTAESDSLRVAGSIPDILSAVGHLIQNAIDAALANEREPTVSVALRTRQGWVEIVIEDNGAGMTEEFIRDELFQPFRSTKGVAGMGIGAYQARTTVRQLGGDLQVTSTIGAGSRFVISLPLDRAET